MSYSQRELDVLTYVGYHFESKDYKLIAPLIRREFNNIRSETAYVSRIYKLVKEGNTWDSTVNPFVRYPFLITFNSLKINTPLLQSVLKSVLKPTNKNAQKTQTETTEKKEIQTVLTEEFIVFSNEIKREEPEETKEETHEKETQTEDKENLMLISEYQHYRLEVVNKFKNMKQKINKKNKKITELEMDLAINKKDAEIVSDKLKLLTDKIKTLTSGIRNVKNRIEEEEKRESEEIPYYNAANFDTEEMNIFTQAKDEDNIRIDFGDSDMEVENKEVKLDENLLKYMETLENETVPRTIGEWKKNQIKTYPLHHFIVKSEQDENKQYKIIYIEKNNSFFCECLAWKFQNLNPKHRTCKHIKAVRGEEIEQIRIEYNGGIWFTKKTRVLRKKLVLKKKIKQ